MNRFIQLLLLYWYGFVVVVETVSVVSSFTTTTTTMQQHKPPFLPFTTMTITTTSIIQSSKYSKKNPQSRSLAKNNNNNNNDNNNDNNNIINSNDNNNDSDNNNQGAAAVSGNGSAGAPNEQCVSENLALESNIELQAAAPYLECNIDIGVSDSCTVDFQPVSGEVATICRELGYQFIEKDIVADCSVNFDGKNYNTDFYYMNVVFCLGPSCSSTELDEALQTSYYPTLESQFAAGGFSNCEISAAVPPSQTKMMAIVIATASVFSLSMMLL